jgi:hypothetical protein
MGEKRYMTTLRLFLIEHPLLVMELGFHLMPGMSIIIRLCKAESPLFH